MFEPILFHLMVQDPNNQIWAYFMDDKSQFRDLYVWFSRVPKYVPQSMWGSREAYKKRREEPEYFLCS